LEILWDKLCRMLSHLELSRDHVDYDIFRCVSLRSSFWLQLLRMHILKWECNQG
jgi:hypothetical protein